MFSLANAPGISSPLQAETQVMLMAAVIASSMRLQDPVKALAFLGVEDSMMLWEISSYKTSYSVSEFGYSFATRIFHISRETNGVARNCVHQEKQQCRSESTYSCRNSAHNNISCPVLAAVASIQQRDFVITFVQCFLS
jgi:hypothetical protein